MAQQAASSGDYGCREGCVRREMQGKKGEGGGYNQAPNSKQKKDCSFLLSFSYQPV